MGKERELWMLRNGGLLLEKRISYFDGKYSNPMRSFSAKELQKATDNYNEKLFLTFGCRCKWYKGCLEGRVVFVKKYTEKEWCYDCDLKKCMYYSIATHPLRFQNLEMVSNEISVAAQLSGHKNSLKLLGCCLETQIPTLVFEFPTNGILRDQLRSNPTCLLWKSRLKIANEIASVITYLHTAFPRPIIHRDIHIGHFYLDQDLCAKLSDFTLCMALPEGKTQVEETCIYGSGGFLAPEVGLRGVYSEKSDVFGFGMLLFDLLKGKNYYELVESKGSMADLKEGHPMDCIQSYIRNHGINGIVDPTILAEGEGVPYHHQFQAVFRLILKCLRMIAEERPIMLDVAKQLRRIQRGNFISDEAIRNDMFSSYNIGSTRLLCHRKALE